MLILSFNCGNKNYSKFIREFCDGINKHTNISEFTLIAFQEMTREHYANFRDEVYYAYPLWNDEISKKFRNGSIYDGYKNGNALVSNEKLENFSSGTTSRSRFIFATMTIDDNIYNVYSVHLPSGKNGYNNRLQIITEIKSQIGDDKSIIIGDFNMLDNEFSSLTSENWIGSRAVNTYFDYPYDRIICCNFNVNIANSIAIRIPNISDHSALLIKLKFDTKRESCTIL